MADQEARKTLRSLNSNTPTHVKFINKSRQMVRAWWLNFSGLPVSYGDIRPGGSLKMNTFLTHPWVFRTSDGYVQLLADREEVYFPTLTEYEDGFPVYKDVLIISQVNTLQEYCCMLIRKMVKREDFDKLDIPECLKSDLTRTPDLLKELQIARAQYSDG
ncbi:von Hippel-Lindau-like protein [Brienomyrus brachyistius]|uniref:von Hippel-Lindau-like protein n=1 Tax=Brienomyrus brachyistius TaxID=42636 RepID=UPI0020B3803D|nr:von Hippel-Lindau-like protein [Brienomyrus brachyistius]